MMVGMVMTWRQEWEPRRENNCFLVLGQNKEMYRYGTTAVKGDMVMASRIDGPSHKWAILLGVSHDTAPIGGHMTVP